MNTATIEHDEQTCVDCLENQLFAARSTIEVLATALRDCVESLKRLPDVDGAYRVTAIKQAEKALDAMTAESEDGLEMSDNSCGECGHPYKRGDETHYPECSRIKVQQ